MIGVFICGAIAMAIFALAALVDERWPDRLSRRGHQLRGEAWRGEYGPQPLYGARARVGQSNAAGLSRPPLAAH
jgi:hypothetical protein